MKQWQADVMKVVLEATEMINADNLRYAQQYIKEILDGNEDKYLGVETCDILGLFSRL